MQWLELSFQDRSPAWIARLEALWTATVQADHRALPRHTVQDLAAGVVQVLRTVAHLTVALDDTENINSNHHKCCFHFSKIIT